MPLRLAAGALFSVACAPASEAPEHGTGGSFSNTGGAVSHTGGISGTTTGGTFSTGGTTGFTGGTSTGTTGGSNAVGGTTTTSTGGTTTTATGGTTTTATGGTTTTATGGTTTTATGGSTTTGTGGATSGCATYDGALATSGASKIFKAGFGTATTPPWKGYAYTYTYGTGAVIKPGSSTAMSCFSGAVLCANGTVPALDSAGAGVGWNLAQTEGTSTTATVSVTGNVKVVLAGAKAGMRVGLGPPTGDEFCYELKDADATAANSATGLTLKAGDFKTLCYGTTGKAYAGEMVKSIQVAVPGHTTGAVQTFDFCLVDIEPG
jgi:hypothetical protein